MFYYMKANNIKKKKEYLLCMWFIWISCPLVLISVFREDFWSALLPTWNRTWNAILNISALFVYVCGEGGECSKKLRDCLQIFLLMLSEFKWII